MHRRPAEHDLHLGAPLADAAGECDRRQGLEEQAGEADNLQVVDPAKRIGRHFEKLGHESPADIENAGDRVADEFAQRLGLGLCDLEEGGLVERRRLVPRFSGEQPFSELDVDAAALGYHLIGE
jgi:hypothetical protein